jgi:hypothetical protein
LGDAAGSNKFIVQDSAGEEVASIDSDGVVTGSNLSSRGVGSVFLPVILAQKVTGDSLAFYTDGAQVTNMFGCFVTPENNNEWTMPYAARLIAGTYTLSVLTETDTDGGKFDVYIDSTKVAEGLDLYSGSTVRNVIKTQASIAIAEGIYSVSVKTNGKHASSSSYYVRISGLWLTRTGA